MINDLFHIIVSIFQATYEPLYIFTYAVAIFLLLTGIDDLFIDILYWIQHFFYPKNIHPYQEYDPKQLEEAEEKLAAIYIPAWHEYDVIDKMLTRACNTLRYKNYDIFVGVYPNDPLTLEKVNQVSAKCPRVHAVVGSSPGPSTKADNLNEIHYGLLKYENQTGKRYDIVVLHDAEDVIDPMSLKIINYFLPKYDMVQLPVLPLPSDFRKIVHWTYCDEFAENHTKDLMVRQIFSGFIPSAGVGTGYNRWLIEFAGSSFARKMFRNASLTEDYDLALRLALAKSKLLYLYRPFKINASTRAFFPDSLRNAVRQKARWLIGICLQSWKTYGWSGDFRFRLMLYRDRKALLSNVLNGLAYIVLFYVFCYEMTRRMLPEYGTLLPLIAEGTMLWYIVLIDTIMMAWRFVHRFLTVSRVYGRLQGILSILRFPVGNLINFLATIRGIMLFTVSLRNDTILAWDKTSHRFPNPDEVPREEFVQ